MIDYTTHPISHLEPATLDNSVFLAETRYLNYSHPAIQSLVSSLTSTTLPEQVLELYYVIRDNIRYNPYTFIKGEESLYASFAATRPDAYCIPKSALMVAACRAIGVPARIGFADVRNHLSSPKLLDWLGTDLFVMHGYAELLLENRWVKCTPVFNLSLCQKFGVKPLEFDGKSNSVFHPFTEEGKPHMEYVNDHGTFEDIPAQLILDTASSTYPSLKMNMHYEKDLAFESD